jgi:hypothetical protein
MGCNGFVGAQFSGADRGIANTHLKHLVILSETKDVSRSQQTIGEKMSLGSAPNLAII